METSALDSTNVEAAFNEVLSGRVSVATCPRPPRGLFDSPADSHDLQPSKRRWPAGRWPAAPSAPWPCPAPSEPLTPRRGRGAAARAPNRPICYLQRWESHGAIFTGKITILTISLHKNALCTRSSCSDQSSRAAIQLGFVACQAHTAFPLSFLKSFSAW